MFLPCLWTLETRRLLSVAGGSSKVEAESSQELQRRQDRERQVDGFRVDSDSEALPKSAFHNLVSEQRVTDGQQVLGTQDKEVTNRAALSKVGHRIYRKVGQPASHSVLCCFNDEFCMIGSSNSVL